MRILSVLTLAIASIGLSTAQLRRCGAPKAPQQLRVAELRESRVANLRYDVDTYVHIITTRAKGGLYPRSMIREQIRVMNRAFSSSRFSFRLKSINYVVNDTWASSTYEGGAEMQYKRELRKGTYKDLNLYFLSDLGQGLLGYCGFPIRNPSEETRIADGCVNLAASMPGGEAQNYNLGATAVHEVGHWLGLFHTFDGASCSGPGDYVSDTPMQLNATGGCPERSDTCPRRAGDDPIHNYMDYSFDSCMWEFSRGQSRRMRSMYDTFRRGQ